MRNEKAMVEFLQARRPGEIAVVPPVVAEIEYGIRRIEPGRKRILLEMQRDRILSVFRVLDWTPEASTNFGIIKSTLEQTGSLIDDFDIAIAAIAMSNKAQVITANLVHFTRIENLPCRHWEDAANGFE